MFGRNTFSPPMCKTSKRWESGTRRAPTWKRAFLLKLRATSQRSTPNSACLCLSGSATIQCSFTSRKQAISAVPRAGFVRRSAHRSAFGLCKPKTPRGKPSRSVRSSISTHPSVCSVASARSTARSTPLRAARILGARYAGTAGEHPLLRSHSPQSVGT